MTEWVFKTIFDTTYLVHQCKENRGYYSWQNTEDKWKNKNLHCYVCGKEPPEEITTQAYLLSVKGLRKHD